MFTDSSTGRGELWQKRSCSEESRLSGSPSVRSHGKMALQGYSPLVCWAHQLCLYRISILKCSFVALGATVKLSIQLIGLEVDSTLSGCGQSRIVGGRIGGTKGAHVISSHCIWESLFGRVNETGRALTDVMTLISVYGACYAAVKFSLVLIHHVVARHLHAPSDSAQGCQGTTCFHL